MSKKSKLNGIEQARVVIENLKPRINCGKHPVKRIVGEPCRVTANAYMEGHDLVSARLLARGPGSKSWQTQPMTYDIHHDLISGSFVPNEIGRWQFTVEAWPNAFESWRSGLAKKVDAGLDVSLELLEGARLVEEAAGRASGKKQTALNEAAAKLGDEKVAAEKRCEVALAPTLQKLIAPYYDPETATRHEPAATVVVDRERARFSSWYEMFPRSQGARPGEHGTFATAAEQLPRLARLGFDVVYLPPIHPIGKTKRKGRNNALQAKPGDPGSPWAIGGAAGGHTAVEPKLGTLADFEGFVERANALGLEVALDYALQCSPDHPWVEEHPDWFKIRPDGSIQYAENPPKKYEDIFPLDFNCEDWQGLWQACRDVFLFWIERGVKIFRVDNPHTKTFAFWEWVIREIQTDHPDVIFLSEAFTRPARMRGLAKLGFTQSYTYFTWRNTPHDVREYLTELTQTEMAEYFRPNFFANTPDILHEYLQRGGRAAFRIRLLLAATLSPSYGIYSGYELCENTPREPGSEEYLNSEKFEIKYRDFDAPGNINEDIQKINRIRRENPALQKLANLSFHHSENDRLLFYRKSAPGNELLIVVNLDPDTAHESTLHVPVAELGMTVGGPYEVEDLLTDETYTWQGDRAFVQLNPQVRVGHVLRVGTRPREARRG